MTTQTLLISSRKPLALTLSIALLFAAPKLHAQDCASDIVELEAALMDLETLGNDIADQRDKCLTLAEQNRKQRDRCEGAFGQLSAVHQKLLIAFAESEKKRSLLEARRKKAILFYGLGVATPIVATLLVAVTLAAVGI